MSYLETCKEAAASIDPDKLAEQDFNKVYGIGGGFVFRGLGAMSVFGLDEYVGLKLPKKVDGDVEGRIIQEVAQINLITDRSPALMSKMPRFTCMLAVSGSEAKAVLTEDFTQGGTKSVTSMRASAEARALLYEPFSKYGGIDKVLEHETLDFATACKVGGEEEKWLDFTPPPLHDRVLWMGGGNELGPHIEVTCNELQDYTIEISADSLLGATLATRHERLAST